MSDPTPLADASVRDARAEDALAIGSVMVASWKQLYADVLPAQTLQSLTPLAVADDWKRLEHLNSHSAIYTLRRLQKV